MGGNGNELSGIVWEWEEVSQCIDFGNGNGNDHVGMGGIGNTKSHSRTPLIFKVPRFTVPRFQRPRPAYIRLPVKIVIGRLTRNQYNTRSP